MNHWQQFWRVVYLRYLPAMLLVAALLLGGAAEQSPPPSPNPWEPAIEAFEKQDREKPPPRNAVLFVGSSSIRLWKLDECFPDLEVINRGFGGSQISDSTHFADRIVIPYRPRIIVFYAGDNDIASGKIAEQVAEDFKAFVEKVHAALPETRILFLSIKPSIARWRLYDEMQKANRAIADFAAQQAPPRRVEFVDVGAALLGEDGRPRPDLLMADGLHLNAEGYKKWSAILQPLLADMPKQQKRD